MAMSMNMRFLPDTEIKAVKTDQGITLSSSKFVKGVELYIDGTAGAVFSDNYFNLIPGESKPIRILIKPDCSKTLRMKGVNSALTMLII